MTDREQLELAYKAANGGAILWADKDMLRHWNPLTDDGDALRLAVKLNLSADFFDDEIAVGYTPNCNESEQVIELVGNDPYAATRRAIVRAAAEIGREMG